MCQNFCCRWRRSSKNVTETGLNSFASRPWRFRHLSGLKELYRFLRLSHCACCFGNCSYESMKCLCDRYNRAIDSIRQLVGSMFMPLAGQTGRCRPCMFYLSVNSLFYPVVLLLPSCEHNILKMNELILMQIGTSDPRGKDMKGSTLRVRSKVKVTWGWNRSQKFLLVRYLELSNEF